MAANRKARKAPSRKPAAPRKPTTEATGRKLAIKMLREMETYETAPGDVNSQWPWSIYAMYRPEGTQQDNVLLRYLDKIGGNRAAMAGFCAVLTDALGNAYCDAGGIMGVPFYKKLTERDIIGKPGPWPKMEDDAPASQESDHAGRVEESSTPKDEEPKPETREEYIERTVWEVKQNLYSAQSMMAGAFLDAFANESGTVTIPNDSSFRRVGTSHLLEAANRTINETHDILEHFECDLKKQEAAHA